MRFPDLQDLSDQASLYCSLSQTYLADHLEEHPGTTGEALVDEIAVAAHLVGQVAVQVTGDAPYYSAPVGGGARAVLMLSGHDFPHPRIDHRIARVTGAFAAVPILDHRRAFHGLAALADWLIAWDDAYTSAEITDPVTGNAITVSFDEGARFTGMKVRLGPT